MSGKYTPGPWRIEPDFQGFIIVGRPKWGAIRCGVEGEWDVAEIDTDGEDDEANAHLIAAAPELLEALEGLLDLSSESGEIDRRLAFKDARAAIAKAKGEAQ